MRHTLSRRGAGRALASGILALAVVTTAAACSHDGTASDAGTTPGSASASSTSPETPITTPTTTSAPTTSSAPSPSATSRGSQLAGIPVYWVGASRQGFALYREFRTVPDTGGAVASAVAAMTRQRPLDPDYVTPWRPAGRVTVTQSGRALRVDLSADAVANTQVGSELAARAVQQLVFTATAAAQQAGTPADTVTLTIDGAARDLWGAVRVGTPVRRAPLLEVQALAWVTSPQEGESRSAGNVAFSGYGTSFEATFTWSVRGAGGTVVKQGSAMGGTGDGGFGAFGFTVALRPGTYVVQVSTDDPSGGAEGRGAATDTKRFTVR